MKYENAKALITLANGEVIKPHNVELVELQLEEDGTKVKVATITLTCVPDEQGEVLIIGEEDL